MNFKEQSTRHRLTEAWWRRQEQHEHEMDRQQKLEALQANIKPEEGGADLLNPGRSAAIGLGPHSRPPTPPGQVLHMISPVASISAVTMSLPYHGLSCTHDLGCTRVSAVHMVSAVLLWSDLRPNSS